MPDRPLKKHFLQNVDSDRRGFERRGDENEINDQIPHPEGAWMYKANGRYYLTCAVPGTEYAAYCDGCAVSDFPMYYPHETQTV